MKNLKKFILVFLFILPTASFIKESCATEIHQPSHIQKTIFQEFVKEVAEEKYDLGFETKGERRVLKAERPNGDKLMVLLPLETKLTEALKFVQQVSADAYPVTFSQEEGQYNVVAVDTDNKRFLITSMAIPTPSPSPTVSQHVKSVEKPNFDQLRQRLENQAQRFDGFMEKAGKDADIASQRLQNCIEKAGKDADKVCRNLGRLFRKND